MKKSALFIFNILFSLACFSSDVQVNNEQKLKQNVTSTSQLMRNDTIISSNDTCADAINTWPATAYSENWFDVTNKNCLKNGITYLKPGLGCIVGALHDDKRQYMLKDPTISCYHRNFAEGPNDEFEVFCVNYQERLIHKIKIYLRARKKNKLRGFDIIAEQPHQAICACAIALSDKNRIALSARNINPSHSPFTIFSITHDKNKPYLNPLSFVNASDGLHFSKLAFLNENELIGLQNTGKILLISVNNDHTITFKKIARQKFLWPRGLKDFAYNTSTNDLISIDHENTIHFSTLQNESIKTVQRLDVQTFKKLISLEHAAVIISLIKSHQEFCGIFFTIDNQISKPCFIAFETNFLKEYSKTGNNL